GDRPAAEPRCARDWAVSHGVLYAGDRADGRGEFAVGVAVQSDVRSRQSVSRMGVRTADAGAISSDSASLVAGSKLEQAGADRDERVDSGRGDDHLARWAAVDPAA